MDQDARANPDKVLEVQHALHEGNLVMVHSRLRLRAQKQDMAVVHVFRFEGLRIMELWDIGQFQPEHVVNEHGMF